MTTSTYLALRDKYRRPQAMMWSDLPPKADGSFLIPSGYELKSIMPTATVTNATPSTPSAGYVTYAANNTFTAGDYVTISGSSIAGYNGTFLITSQTSTTFVVVNSTTGTETFTSGLATAIGDFVILSDHNRKDISFKTERIEKRERMINGRMRSYHVADKMTIDTSWDMLPSRAFSLNPQFSPTTGLATASSISQYTVDGGAGGNELLDWYNNHTGSFYVFLAYDKGTSNEQYGNLAKYNEVVEMFISSFDYTVVKRGGSNYDFWNVSVSLEEV